MSRRHLPLLLVVAACALCAVVAFRVLDDESSGASDEPLEAPTLTPDPLVTLERGPQPDTMRLAAPDERPPPPTREWAPPPEPDLSTGLDEAKEALARLRKLLKSARSTNADILDALARVHDLYLHPPPPPGFVVHAQPKDGPSPKGRIVSEANLRQFADEQGWPAAYVKEVLAFRKGAEKQFLEALRLRHDDREANVNTREPVNIAAANVLGASGNPKLTKKITSIVERSILKAKYEVSSDLYAASFAALATLGDPSALEWMEEEFINSKSSPPRVVAQTIAGHEAMLLFDPKVTPAKTRHRLVQELVKTYAGVEARSGESPFDEYWRRVGPGAIRAVQHFAGRPRDTGGRRIDTMAGFTVWFREHKNPNRPPWRDR